MNHSHHQQPPKGKGLPSSSFQLAKSLDRHAIASSSTHSGNATVSSSGSKSPHRNKTKMMVLAQSSPSGSFSSSTTSAKEPHVRKRMGRRASTDFDPPSRGALNRTQSSDTYGFNADDWQDSFTEDGGFLDNGQRGDDKLTTSPSVAAEASTAGGGFSNPQTAIRPLTRKVDAKDANWFSEWESDFDDDDEKKKDDCRRPAQKRSSSQSKAEKGQNSSHLSKASSHSKKTEASTIRTTQNSKSHEMDSSRRGTSKTDSHETKTATHTGTYHSRRGKNNDENDDDLDNSRRGTGKNTSPQKPRSMTGSKSGGGDDSDADTDLDSSRRGRKSSVQSSRAKLLRSGDDDDADMDKSRRGRQSSPHKAVPSAARRNDSNEDDDMDTSRRGRKSSPNKKPSLSSARECEDDLDASRRGTKKPGKAAKRSTVGSDDDDDLDSSRRGSRRGGSDILQRRNVRRSNSADDDERSCSDDVSLAESTASAKAERVSRLTALRRATMSTGTVEDSTSRGRRSSLDDDVRPARRASTSVSRRASVAGCSSTSSRTGRDAERREEEGVRHRSRSRRASTRGKKLDKPPACKEKSMLGDRDDSEQAEEDDIEALFKKAHEKERQEMLDKSRVGPVRALEKQGKDHDKEEDDDDDDDDRNSPVQKRKANGYLPGSLNDTATNRIKSKSKLHRSTDEKSSRRGSLDDLLNMDSHPNLLSCSASVQPDGSSGTGGYNPANVDNYFSSSASVPGDVDRRSSSKASSGEWAHDVDQLLGARRRAHGADSPRSHKGQLYGSTPATPAAATVVSVEYANKMQQLQQAKTRRGGPGLVGTGAKPQAASDFILPMLVTPAEKTKKKNPLSLGLRRHHVNM